MNVFELIKEKLEEVSFADIDEQYADDGQRMLFLYDGISILDEAAQEYAKTPTPTHPIPIDTQQYIEELEAKVNNNGWIPCSERLPELYTSVLVCEENGEIHLCGLHNNNRFYYDGSDWDIKLSEVTHWQPLPTLPKPYKEGGTE